MESLTLPGISLYAGVWKDRECLTTKLGTIDVTNTLVTTTDQLARMVSFLKEKARFIYDSETSGRNPHLGARVVGHAFAFRPSATEVLCWYVPIRHSRDNAIPQLPVEVVTRAVQEIFATGGEAGFHNDKFDRWFLRKEGIHIARRTIDTARRATIANENEQSFGLKQLADKYIVRGASSQKDEVEAFARKDAETLRIPYKQSRREDEHEAAKLSYLERYGYSRVPIVLLGQYACRDVLYTALLMDFYEWTARTFSALSDRENAVSDALHDMEWYGLPFNTDEVRHAQVVAQEERDFYRQRIHQIVGYSFEMKDSAFRELLFNQLKMEPKKLTKTGEIKQRDARKNKEEPAFQLSDYAVDKEARELLIGAYPQHKRLLLAMSGFAAANKIATTYTDGLLSFFSPETGCIHPVYNQLEGKDEGGVPVTGRLSSASPNIQNIARSPLHVRRCDCAKCVKGRLDGTVFDSQEALITVEPLSIRRYFPVRPGYIRAYVDFSQIELRVLAWLSRDPTLLHCYANDLDVHKITAEEVTGGDRDVAKQVNFGNSYGMMEVGLAKRMKGYATDPEGTRVRARAYLQAFFKKYYRIPQFRDELAAQIRRTSDCSFVSPFGRPRRLPELKDPKEQVRHRGERRMMSSMVSGTAADLMKEVLIRARAWLQRACPEALVIQTIHDEIIYEVPERYAAPLLHGIMEITTNWPMFEKGGVPIRANMALTNTTWEKKKEAVFVNGELMWQGKSLGCVG